MTKEFEFSTDKCDISRINPRNSSLRTDRADKISELFSKNH